MIIDLETWLETENYDLSKEAVSDEIFNQIIDKTEELAQEVINKEIGNIGQKIVSYFNLKKKKGTKED